MLPALLYIHPTFRSIVPQPGNCKTFFRAICSGYPAKARYPAPPLAPVSISTTPRSSPSETLDSSQRSGCRRRLLRSNALQQHRPQRVAWHDLRCGEFIQVLTCGLSTGLFFCCTRGAFLGTVEKALSLPWVGPLLSSFSSMHGQSPKEHAWTESEESPPSCPRVYLYLHQRGQGLKKLFLRGTGFSSTPPRIHDQKNLPPQRTGLSGRSAARIKIPRARGLERKTFLTQGRVVNGRLVYPWPPKSLKERSPCQWQWGVIGPCARLQMASEANETHAASKKTENTLTIFLA